MGLTPLEGLMMGTRTGDIDPAVVFHLQRVAGMTVDEVDTLFNKKSGMKGMTGESDMRSVWEVINNTSDPEASKRARTAMDVYINRLLKYVGSYLPLSSAAWTSSPSLPASVRTTTTCAASWPRPSPPSASRSTSRPTRGPHQGAAHRVRSRLGRHPRRLPDQRGAGDRPPGADLRLIRSCQRGRGSHVGPGLEHILGM